jgi:hypothetical protein
MNRPRILLVHRMPLALLPPFTGGVGDLALRHKAQQRSVTLINCVAGTSGPSLVDCRVMDYDEGTSNVSPGRRRRIVAAPLMAVGRRELLRCNYRRSDTIRPSCQQRSEFIGKLWFYSKALMSCCRASTVVSVDFESFKIRDLCTSTHGTAIKRLRKPVRSLLRGFLFSWRPRLNPTYSPNLPKPARSSDKKDWRFSAV